MKLFGLEIVRKKETQPLSVVTPINDDGSTIVSAAAAGYYAQVMELEARIKNETDLIRRYREIAQYSDCDSAIDDICNEAVVIEEDKPAVSVNLDKLRVSEAVKKKIRTEFDHILFLLKFNEQGHDIFRTWYIDGRIYFHVVVDEKNPNDGIMELRQIDPRKIRKIKDVKKTRTDKGIEIISDIQEYYLYNDRGITETTIQGVRLPIDSVIYAPSGLIDANSQMTLSFLHKAIKLVNQLKMLEDAVVIYRITRAPERRIFYIDVGNMPKIKAEQYVNDLMNKFKNKVTYDPTTGETKDARQQLSMMEDFFLPRRGTTNSGTEITTLPGLQNANALDDLQYFQNKLFQALNVPLSRLKGDTGFNLGRASEITRDEVKFNKFISRIRAKFSKLLLDALKVQLILKNIINPDDWDEIREFIRFDFMRDNYFAELKESEIMANRLNMLQTVDQFVGKYFTMTQVNRDILRRTDEDLEAMRDDWDKDREFEIAMAEHSAKLQQIQQEIMSSAQPQEQPEQSQPNQPEQPQEAPQ